MVNWYKDPHGQPICRRAPQGNDRDRMFHELAYVFRTQRERIRMGWAYRGMPIQTWRRKHRAAHQA